MSHFRIKGPSPIIVMIPGNRMMLPIFSALIAGLVYFYQYLYFWVDIPKIIPLVRLHPCIGHRFGSWVFFVNYIQPCLLNFRVALKIGAH